MNKFSAGLVTDASPLTSPDNSSLAEDNMVLNIDGSRNRRSGMDYEEGNVGVGLPIPNIDSVDITISTYRWDNAGGDPEKSIEVVQTGSLLRFFHLVNGAISANLFESIDFFSGNNTRFSFAVVDGVLVVVNGNKDIYLIEFEEPGTLTMTTRRLLVRDMFGVEDIYFGTDIARGSNVQNRTSSLTDNHAYNLRNQSFGVPRIDGNSDNPADPIAAFENATNTYPSNSDTVIEALYPDAADTDNRTVDRFFPLNLYRNPVGTTRAPLGYFIIDALDRGASRFTEYANNQGRYPDLTYNISSLSQDETPSGATSITEFAGRVWYGGFPGKVIDGDSHSPKLSSYVFFSRVVENNADINLCYQEGDPTSKNSPDIVATDGGFIRLNEAYGIQKLINLGSSLMVVASNGVWRIVGGSDTGFTATAYIVEKITDRGCTSPDSIVTVDNSFMFWSDDAIYHVVTDQFGSWVCNNVSFGRIQRFYDDISIDSKRKAYGGYDSYERKARWVFNNATTNTLNTRELVFDTQLNAFYTNTIMKLDNQQFPKVVAMYTGQPYQITTSDVTVLAGTDAVLVNSDAVMIGLEEKTNTTQREIGYLVIMNSDGGASGYTFATYRNEEFRDFFNHNSLGADAEAYVVTNYMSGGDFQRDKGVKYITVHLRRTETGYLADMTPLNQSSCLVQARWGWANSDASGKWGREFQAYRYRRNHLPQDSADDYDTGFATINSRNKLRGSGAVLSLRFRTEPYKNLHLYGWSMIFAVEEDV